MFTPNSNLVSPPSRAVIVRDEVGVSIHSTEDEDKSAYVSKPEVYKDVTTGPNLSLKLKAEDGQEVDPSVQDTIMDVNTLVRFFLVATLPHTISYHLLLD